MVVHNDENAVTPALKWGSPGLVARCIALGEISTTASSRGDPNFRGYFIANPTFLTTTVTRHPYPYGGGVSDCGQQCFRSGAIFTVVSNPNYPDFRGGVIAGPTSVMRNVGSAMTPPQRSA